MANTLTPNLQMVVPGVGTTGYAALVNAVLGFLDALAPLGALAVAPKDVDPATGLSTSLRVQVNAGTFVKSDGTLVGYAGTGGSPLTLTAATTTYLWLTDAGVLTTGAGFPAAGTKCVRLAAVTCDASKVTAVADCRVTCVSAG